MKKTLAFLLALVMMLAAVPAMALEADDVFGAFDENDRGHWDPPYDHSQWKKMVGFELKQDAVVTAKVYDPEGNLFNTLVTDEQMGAGYVVINWPAVDVNGWHADKGVEVVYDLEITAEVNGEIVTTRVPYEIIYSHSFADHVSTTAPVWYPDNTMGLVGLPLRDTFPGLTSKWYHVVPVDLTVDGTTTIPMVASNLFFISNAHVTVDGDNVTVTYDGLPKFGNGWIIDECVAWFTSVDQITTEWLDAPESDLEFGQTISRANDLGDAEIALLFVCNHLTYRQPYFDDGAALTRYWPNLTEWKEYRTHLTTMLDQMYLVTDSPAAELVTE